jgi:hypothetical protein
MNATNVPVHMNPVLFLTSCYIYIISNFICLSDLPSSPFTLSLVPVPPIPASTTYYIQGRYLTPNIGETIPERYPVTDNHDRRLNVQRTRALL